MQCRDELVDEYNFIILKEDGELQMLIDLLISAIPGLLIRYVIVGRQLEWGPALVIGMLLLIFSTYFYVYFIDFSNQTSSIYASGTAALTIMILRISDSKQRKAVDTDTVHRGFEKKNNVSEKYDFENSLHPKTTNRPGLNKYENQGKVKEFTCSNCKKIVYEDDNFCPDCGADLSKIVDKCSSCDSEVSNKDNFCSNCGYKLID